jgi:hypothetical protein
MYHYANYSAGGIGADGGIAAARHEVAEQIRQGGFGDSEQAQCFYLDAAGGGEAVLEQDQKAIAQHGAHFAGHSGHAGKQPAAALKGETGRCAHGIWHYCCALGEHGLRAIALGHFSAGPGEEIADCVHGRFVKAQLLAAGGGDGLAGEVVERGAKPSGADADISAVHHVAEQGGYFRQIVSDGVNGRDGEAGFGKCRGDFGGIRVRRPALNQFGADGQYFDSWRSHKESCFKSRATGALCTYIYKG